MPCRKLQALDRNHRADNNQLFGHERLCPVSKDLLFPTSNQGGRCKRRAGRRCSHWGGEAVAVVGRVLMYGHRGHAAHRIVAFHGNMVTGQLLRSSHHGKHSPKNQSFCRALLGYRLASSQKRQPTSEPVDHIDFRFWAGGMCASPRRTSIPLYSPVFLLGIFIFAVSLYFLGSGSPVMALIQSQP